MRPTVMSEGFGRNTWTLEPEAITKVVKVSSNCHLPPLSRLISDAPKYTWITQVAYIPAIILTKVSILLFFTRVFPDHLFQKICIGTIIYCILFMVSTFIATILACIPVEAAWSNWAGGGEGLCYDNNAYWWAHSVRISRTQF